LFTLGGAFSCVRQLEVIDLAKKQISRFIDSVPEMVGKLRSFKDLTMGNPEIPFPWPPYVPPPETLDSGIGYVQKVYDAIGDVTIRTGGELERARKSAKTEFSQLASYAASMLRGGGYCDLARWPGFDLGRNPGESRCGTPYRASPPLVRTEQGD